MTLIRNTVQVAVWRGDAPWTRSKNNGQKTKREPLDGSLGRLPGVGSVGFACQLRA